MVNELKMNKRKAILQLAAQKYGIHAIRRMTGCHRKVIRRVIAEAKTAETTTATAESALAELIAGVGHFDRPPAPAASRSKAAPHHDYICQALKDGVDAMNIYDRLVENNHFPGSYTSIRRYVAAMQPQIKTMVGRMVCLPGEEAQIDFGIGAEVRERGAGRRKKPWLFKMTLSYSGHSYEEVVWHQDVETFIACHIRAFEALGGVAVILIPDNLKAAILTSEWYDFTENPQYLAFAKHYGFAILPHRPAHPQHKGKVERDIDYTQRALHGLVFATLAEQNAWLRRWNERRARLRIHGTHKEQVWRRFTRDEQEALLPLPATPFVMFACAPRTVHYDGYVQVDHNFYSAPAALVRRSIEARWDERLVRLFDGETLLRTHVRHRGRGHFFVAPQDERTHPTHSQLKFLRYLKQSSEDIGPEAAAFTAALFEYRGLQAIRQVQGLLSLRDKYSDELIASACGRAVTNGALHGKHIADQCRREAAAGKAVAQLSLFSEPNEFTRSLAEYDTFAEGVTDESPDDAALEGIAAVRPGRHAGSA